MAWEAELSLMSGTLLHEPGVCRPPDYFVPRSRRASGQRENCKFSYGEMYFVRAIYRPRRP